MSYREREGGYKRPAGIGIIVAAGLGLWFFGPALVNAGKREHLSRPANFEAQLMADPEAGELFKTMKVTNPDQLRDFVDGGAQKIHDGASEDEMHDYTRRFMISLMKDQPRQLSVAPHEDLVAAVTAQSRMYDKAREIDVPTCAQMSATGSASGAPDALHPEIVAAGSARLRAAAAGRDRPQPPGAKVNAADVRALIAQMRNDGLSEGDAHLFTTGIDAASAPPQSQCDITLYSYRAALELPKDQGDRLMRWLFAP